MKRVLPSVKIRAGFPFLAVTAFFLSGDMWLNYLYALIFALLHETGHLLAMVYFGCIPDSIVLGMSGIKIIKKELSLSPFQECITALSGPFVNLVMMLIFSFRVNSLPFILNTGLLLFNLLPLKNLDGGRFLYNMTLHFSDASHAISVLFAAEGITLLLLVLFLVVSLIKDFANTTFVFFVLMIVFSTLADMVKG